MTQKLVKLGIKRQKGYLYYIDKKGDVSCTKMARGNKKRGNPKKVVKCGIRRKEGYLYFIDKRGDVSCAKIKRWAKKKHKGTESTGPKARM